MKKLILSFIAFTALTLSAQDKIQWSTVREQNSNKRPIANVQVIFSDAAPSSSDQNGKLRLAFKDKKPGTYVFLTEVQKAGYELVNNKELEQVKISGGDQFGVDIILAKSGLVEASKKEYYGISDKSLKAGFEREKAKLRGNLQAARLTAEQFEKEKAQLEVDYERQQKELDALADKFARVNFDDVSAVYKEALESFKAGKIDEAIAKLESVNPTKRTEAIIKEQKRIANAQAELDSQKVALEKEKRQQIANLRLLADMYSLKFDPVKAEAQYDDLLRLDSTDLDLLKDASNFYTDNHFYNKAKRTYYLIIEHPNAEVWKIANTYGTMGELYLKLGNFPAALDAITKALENHKWLIRDNPNYYIYRLNYIVSSFIIGEIYKSSGNLEKALVVFEECNKLSREIYETHPLNESSKDNLATSYSKLGHVHTSLGNLEKALTFYEQSNRLTKELSEVSPLNIRFKRELAVSYQRLGYTLSLLGELKKASTFFEESCKLNKELNEAYPQNVDFKNELAISYQSLGQIQSSLGDLAKALTFIEQYNQLEKELVQAYPQNVEFKNALASSYDFLGVIHNSMKNLDNALMFFEQYSILAKELFLANPQNLDFKNSLATAYERLGSTYNYMGNLEKALVFFEKNMEISKEIYMENVFDVNYKNGLSIAYSKLGSLHTTLGNLEKALNFFEKDLEMAKELYSAYPQNVEFKDGLAIAYSKLGTTHSSLNNLDKALSFFEQYNSLKKELHEAYPLDVNYKNGLAISYEKLGTTHSALGNLEQALAFFEQYNNLEKQFYTANPQNSAFKDGLAISYAKLGTYYLDKKMDVAKARYYFSQCQLLWQELIKTNPTFPSYTKKLAWVDEAILELDDYNDPVFRLQKRIDNEPDSLIQYNLYSILCDSLRQRAFANPQHKKALAEAINNWAWLGLFLKKFEAVEANVKEGMALKTDDKFLVTNLAPALLFQGKRMLAITEYQKWKDQPFGEPNLPTYREAFLEDLKAFEKAGIIPPERKADVEAVRKLLNEPKKK